jgi:hypothetical protein
LAKLINFAGLPAEFLMFRGLFFRQMQNAYHQWFIFIPVNHIGLAKIRLGRNLMVWHFFGV